MGRCWISSDFQSKRPLVSYITTVAFPLLVVLFNACMLGLVVCKMRKLRSDDKKMSFGSSSDWKETNKKKRKRLWRDCVTVLGLSFVLGLPWGLASTTYVSLAGIYIFTILNSLQGYYLNDSYIKYALDFDHLQEELTLIFLLFSGLFIFLWSVGLARKSWSGYVSLVRDSSKNDEHQLQQPIANNSQYVLSMMYIRSWLLNEFLGFCFFFYMQMSILKKCSYDSYGCIIFSREGNNSQQFTS